MEADGSFQRVMGFALVEPNLGTALQIGIQNPVDHEQGPLDATDLAQGCGQFVLPWIGGELAQNLAGRDAPGRDGGGDAQDIGPVALDHGLIDFSADHGPQVGRGGRWIERIEPLGRQIADAGREPVAENGARGEDMIGEAARVGELLADMAAGVVHEQAVEDVRGFARRRGDHLGCKRRVLVRDVTVGFQAGGIAIFCVDQVHGLALLCRGEELAVARSRGAHAPELGHG